MDNITDFIGGGWKKEMGDKYLDLKLGDIKANAERVQGLWNGDESGMQEEKAQIAGDVVEAIQNLVELLEELNS